MEKAICVHCKAEIKEKPSRTLLGFLRYKCKQCNKYSIYPLTTAYRSIYWILIVLFAFIALGNLSRGIVVLPGFLLIAGIVALLKDKKIRKAVLAVKP